jgi:hypothetical protein
MVSRLRFRAVNFTCRDRRDADVASTAATLHISLLIRIFTDRRYVSIESLLYDDSLGRKYYCGIGRISITYLMSLRRHSPPLRSASRPPCSVIRRKGGSKWRAGFVPARGQLYASKSTPRRAPRPRSIRLSNLRYAIDRISSKYQCEISFVHLLKDLRCHPLRSRSVSRPLRSGKDVNASAKRLRLLLTRG